MGITVEQIQEEIKTNPDFVNTLADKLSDNLLSTDKFKTVIENKATTIYQEKIGEEVSKIHKQYDEDAFSIIGERPGVLEGGKKQKTYDFLKDKLKELADLRKQKDSLTKDAKVKELEAQIETLKAEGGGKHWEQTFETEKAKWLKEREELETKAKEASEGLLKYQKEMDIQSGLANIQLDETIPEMARKALIDNVKNQLIQRSKIVDGKVVYLDEKGAIIQNKEYAPASAGEILQTQLKDVLKKDGNQGGGGADPDLTGKINVTNKDGKNVKRLNLPIATIKTKSDFVETVEETLLKSGVVRGSDDWKELYNEAYERYQVDKMPRI